MPHSMYFIAILLPEKVSAEVTAFKKHIATHYNSKSALRTMPHITLKAPFKLPVEEHESLLRWFQSLEPGSPFTIDINGFGAFPNLKNPVLFAHPELNDSLAALQSSIIHGFQKAYPEIQLSHHENTFSPHITIGYRDWGYTEFENAWQEFQDKEYKTTFTAKSIVLLQHDGAKWVIAAEASLHDS